MDKYMPRIGFTGTRQGMNDKQLWRLKEMLYYDRIERACHGDCIGADAQFDAIVCDFWGYQRLCIHPPIDPSYRAFLHTRTAPAATIQEREDYIERNHSIVTHSEIMFATPRESIERGRGSGTWATIRHSRTAIQLGTLDELHIIYPDGSVESSLRTRLLSS